MAIPSHLIALCDSNAYVWHRNEPAAVRKVFAALELPESSQLCQFLQCYSMQFLSHKLDYELIDIVDDDGCASDIVDYAHNELGIDLHYLPISTYEAESLFAVDTLSNAVVHATPDDANGDWNYEVLNTSFYGYMVAALS